MPYPALAGREPESRELADAVRRLIAVCTSTTAPADTTLAAARELNAVADRLERHVPDPPHPMTMLLGPAIDADDESPDLAARMPYDVVVGRHSPLALPLSVSFEPPKALLRGTFTRPYQGPPGCVHGAVLAASFDLVCAAANVIAGLPARPPGSRSSTAAPPCWTSRACSRARSSRRRAAGSGRSGGCSRRTV
ncbi:hypothetical protein BJF79_09115 [Actinomadura sp. CNU-125]|nr:hypothetical protein BJF79_09115 [Actinomadura sp. CNU-125]